MHWAFNHLFCLFLANKLYNPVGVTELLEQTVYNCKHFHWWHKWEKLIISGVLRNWRRYWCCCCKADKTIYIYVQKLSYFNLGNYWTGKIIALIFQDSKDHCTKGAATPFGYFTLPFNLTLPQQKKKLLGIYTGSYVDKLKWMSDF